MTMMAEWAKKAACRGQDLRLFYPDEYQNHPDLVGTGTPDQRYKQAAKLLSEVKELCAYCPVAAECYSEAVQMGDWHGIRGGLDGIQRRKLEGVSRRGHMPERAGEALHLPGQESEYYYKRRCPCDGCKDKHNAHARDMRARARARAS